MSDSCAGDELVMFLIYKTAGLPSFAFQVIAQMAELADAADSKSASERIVGSTPTLGTTEETQK